MKLLIVILETVIVTLGLHAVTTATSKMSNVGVADDISSLATCADTIGFGRCPVVEPMKDLNVSRLYGQWYMAADYTDPRYSTQKCITRLMSNGDGDDGTGDADELNDQGCRRTDILEGWIDDVTGEHHQMDSWIVSPDVNDKMHMVHTMAMRAPMRWYPLATDYDTYLATYVCVEFPPDCPVVHRIYSAICSRDVEFSKEQYSETLKIYAKFGINLDNFRYFDNTGCEST